LIKSTRVVSPGAPVIKSQGGFIGPNLPTPEFDVTLPLTMVPTTTEFIFEIYPTNYALLVEAIRNIIVGPSYCYDCVASNTYGLILVH